MVALSWFIITCFPLCAIHGVIGVENYCPGDQTNSVAPHSSQSRWPGWHCRRNAMSFRGTLETLESIDFAAIETANKSMLRIHLTNRKVSTIPSRIFEPLQNLRVLDLHLNATLIPSHLFDTLSNLQHLSIYTYQEQIAPTLFAQLYHLQYLKLHIRPKHMRLQPHQQQCPQYEIPTPSERPLHAMIPAKLFQPLAQLQNLYISCQCESLAANTFQYNSELTTLVLRTKVSRFPSTIFYGLRQLSTLQIESKDQDLILSQKLFLHLHAIENIELKAKSIYVASRIFALTKNLLMLSFDGILQNLHENMFETLQSLHWLDLGSTKIASLPSTLIHGLPDLQHLRLEGNNIERVPMDFFKYSSKISSLILSHNLFASLRYDIFYPLRNLHDLHLQFNSRFLMYCDYGFGDASLFPRLRTVYMEGLANKCVHPWLVELMRRRTDLSIFYEDENTKEKMKSCPLVQIENITATVARNETLKLQFKGPKIFTQHKAYWISNRAPPCSDFRSIHKLNASYVGHREVSIDDDGTQLFVFQQTGTYSLVYQYGNQSEFLPYYHYEIRVL